MYLSALLMVVSRLIPSRPRLSWRGGAQFCLLLLAAWFCSAPMVSAAQAAEVSAPVAASQPQATSVAPLQQGEEALGVSAIMELLRSMHESIERKQDKLRGLRLELRVSDSEEDKKALEERITALQQDINDDLLEFYSLASGEELQNFQTELKSDFKLSEQIETILAPLLRELSEFTQRPREMDLLRTRIQFKQERLPAVEAYLQRIDTLMEKTQDLELKERLTEVRAQWEEVKATLENDLQLARYKLEQLKSDRRSFSSTLGKTLESFFKTRGKNLLLAGLTFLAVFFLLRWLHSTLFKLPKFKSLEKHSFAFRLFNLTFVFFVVATSSAAALALLYAAGDWLLLVIFFILLFSIIWSAKEGLLQYWEEIKLVLNVGGVREGERIIYRGIPWRVQRLNYYTRLENPELAGGPIRVRLRDLIDHVTRPFAPDEPWFPSRKGDWVLLNDGTYGRIVQQSADMVRLWLYGSSYKTYQTESYLQQNPIVLSTGFLVRSDFGVDYSLQDIVTTDVPQAFEQAVRSEIEKAGKADALQGLTVDFLQAGASSLDIVIFATVHGSAADSYYVFGRLIQRACVKTCTAKGWTIPFPQLTVHSQQQTPKQP